MVETVPDRAWLRTLGLRLAASLRQPVEVTGRDGEPVRVRVDFGVGLVLLGRRNTEPEDVLDDAQRLAEAACDAHPRGHGRPGHGSRRADRGGAIRAPQGRRGAIAPSLAPLHRSVR